MVHENDQVICHARSKFRRVAWSVADEVQDLKSEVRQLRDLLELHASKGPAEVLDLRAAVTQLQRELLETRASGADLRAEVNELRKLLEARTNEVPSQSSDGQFVMWSCVQEAVLNVVKAEVGDLQSGLSQEILELRAEIMARAAAEEALLRVELDNKVDNEALEQMKFSFETQICSVHEALRGMSDSEALESLKSAFESQICRLHEVIEENKASDMSKKIWATASALGRRERHLEPEIASSTNSDFANKIGELQRLIENQKADTDQHINLQAQEVHQICSELSQDTEDLRAALGRNVESLMLEQKAREDMQDHIDGLKREAMHMLGDLSKLSLTVAQMNEDKEAEKIQRKLKLGQCFWPYLAQRGGSA
eukprot:gnl/MRDRNA2_/MRDRNA2_100023_c0_seq1.p1 gnl/MRDRNA2_/MRDRNA2_100023_c0~~gnl/MRDRNA2_/MRDRNA2_100023_c0_seq1.p1  ORF type:complete len:369 (+),score=98.25 gnl/MRDRNA2_/MRDRNA2_100023_c0_seq1:73-1179(+)